MNRSPTIVEIEAVGVRFFSPSDESAFFEWLDKLQFVEKYEGRGRTLYISVNSSIVDEDGLRELLALFRRYGVGMRQLVMFDRDDFAHWFRNKQAYWYNDIFG
jgi:hypothetical protein